MMEMIDGVDALAAWLEQQQIDTALWGSANKKSVADLWEELKHGEIQLHCNPPLREVRLVQIIIRQHGRVLLEVEQEFGTGQRRKRNIFPSEKLRGGEDYLTAAKRGLKEELNIEPEQVIFLTDSYLKKQRRSTSPSYPNLPTQYTIHSIEAAVSGLPTADFWCENQAYSAGDPIKQHRWGWRPETAVAPFR